jgi:hypothetical protein
MMSDPHVVALYYKVLIHPGLDFAEAQPLPLSEPDFDVLLNVDGAQFTMRRHFATEQDALEVVRQYVGDWNIWTGLELLPDRFRLEYSHCEIVDRSPTPGVHALHAINLTTGSPEPGRPSPRVPRNRFPRPPTNFQASRDVNAMYSQYRAHKEGGMPLAHTAYFLLTVLEQGIEPPNQSKPYKPTKKRSAAAEKFVIILEVLQKIGELTTTRGGESARKVGGLHSELTLKEKVWLEEAMKMMIRRAGEVAANPNGPHEQITMDHLPRLPARV